MSKLIEQILSVAKTMPEGKLLYTKEFLHLGSRASIDKTFSRLTQEGKLMRVSRGAYAIPYEGRFGVRSPSTQSVIQSIEASYCETIVDTGTTEANALGLTTQVPVREVFLTSGPSRTLQLGNRCVELKHGKRWQLALGKRLAGSVVRAVAWIGSDKAPQALKELKVKLPESEWKALLETRHLLPSWMAKAVSEVI